MGDAPLIGILDDEEHFRRALTRLLQAHQYRIMDFASGPEFLAESGRRRFDCILLDLAMPGMSGFEVLEVLRGDPAAPPAIVITGIDDREVRQRARDLTAFECLTKPVPDTILVGTIERALKR